MCDETEAIYSPNDVVWVKLGPVWWPGRVCGDDEIPPEIMKDLRKKPIAIVKFFQEDSFEYVKSLSNIYHYHCPRKNEFIKKGLDLLRSKNSGAPSNMKLFPEDIVRAEHLTHGNPAILQSDIFLPEEKPVYTDIFTSKRTPKKVKSDAKRKQIPSKQSSPRLITHPRFLQLSSGQSTDYEVREREQIPVRAECDVEDSSPLTVYSCTECDYMTTRLNVIVWHNKSHTRNYASPQVSKTTKRKSTTSVKLKDSLSSSPNLELKADDVEGPNPAKIPKTNGTLTVTPSPRKRGRPKGSTSAKKMLAKNTPSTNKANSTSIRTPTEKGRRGSVHKGDEIHKSLLEDWLEDDLEQEELATEESLESGEGDKTLDVSRVASNDSNSKSCFDFDDSEDHLVIDEQKFTPGRKIPRLLRKSAPSTLVAEDVMQDSVDALEVDATADPAPQYQRGVEDMDGESTLSHSRTSRLQEIGVDNEIEIKTEETRVDEVVKSVPPKKSRRNLKTEKKNDAVELQDQVDKLLNEISKAPAKLPDIPRSHKKAQLKAYQQQAEAEKLAAQKISEAEAAKVAVEAEAAQKVADEAEAARRVAAEATQKVAAEAEVAQKAAAEAVQRVAAEAVAAQKVAAKAETLQRAAAEAKSALVEAELKAAEKTTLEKEAAGKMLAAQPSVDAKEAYNLHPETMDIEVSDIPLPSPRKCPTTSDLIESSTSIGASVTVTEDKTSDEQSSVISPSKTSSETLVASNVDIEVSDSNSSAADQKKAAVALRSSQISTSAVSVVEGGAPAATNIKTPGKLATCKTTKIVHATSPLRSGHTFKFISQNEYQKLVNKLKVSAGQVSPSKTSAQSLNTTTTTANLLCNLTQPLANSPSSGSPKKILILTKSKKAGVVSTSATTTATAATSTLKLAGRSITVSNATTVRVTPNMLQQSAAAQKAVAALAKSAGKNIVLDASTFQSLFQTQPQQLCEVQSQVAATIKPQTPSAVAVAGPSQPGIQHVAGGTSTADSNGDCANTVSSSSTAGQTVSYNYIVDSSGNLVQVAPPTAHTPTKENDILAKALENTDGLQTEMALSQAATNDVLDNVIQTPETACKMDVLYENPILNTAPIMSTHEMPSQAVATVNVPAETVNEMALGSGATDNKG